MVMPQHSTLVLHGCLMMDLHSATDRWAPQQTQNVSDTRDHTSTKTSLCDVMIQALSCIDVNLIYFFTYFNFLFKFVLSFTPFFQLSQSFPVPIFSAEYSAISTLGVCVPSGARVHHVFEEYPFRLYLLDCQVSLGLMWFRRVYSLVGSHSMRNITCVL